MGLQRDVFSTAFPFLPDAFRFLLGWKIRRPPGFPMMSSLYFRLGLIRFLLFFLTTVAMIFGAGLSGDFRNFGFVGARIFQVDLFGVLVIQAVHRHLCKLQGKREK